MLPLTPWTHESQAPDSNRNASRMRAGRAPARLQVASEGVEPPLPGCGPGVVAVGPRGRVGPVGKGTRPLNSGVLSPFPTAQYSPGGFNPRAPPYPSGEDSPAPRG